MSVASAGEAPRELVAPALGFVPDGVAIGSRAGGCEVPRPTRRDRAGLLAAAAAVWQMDISISG